VDALRDEPLLATYSYTAAARADFLRRLGDLPAARLAYEEALLLTVNDVERDFLHRRLSQL
jgi:RNA polymerase sigma-70 factor (ECF subfamily)